jgi:hypothetical protein
MLKPSFLYHVLVLIPVALGCSENGMHEKPEPELKQSQVEEWNAGRKPEQSELPEDAQKFLRIIQENADHPHIKKYFHQITLCYIQGPKEPIPFFLMEFRDKLNSGLVWTDGVGNWGTGGWLPLESEDATPQLEVSYLQGSAAYPTCLDAIDALIAMKRVQ